MAGLGAKRWPKAWDAQEETVSTEASPWYLRVWKPWPETPDPRFPQKTLEVELSPTALRVHPQLGGPVVALMVAVP